MSLAIRGVYRAQVQALRTDLARVTAERDAAIDVLEMLAPRPWEAVAEDDATDDNGEWSIYDANGNRLASSWGPKDGTSPSPWARATCETVNALGGEKP